jgi:hypothetical protein
VVDPGDFRGSADGTWEILRRAGALQAAGKGSEGIAVLRRAVGRLPDLAEAHHSLGERGTFRTAAEAVLAGRAGERPEDVFALAP